MVSVFGDFYSKLSNSLYGFGWNGEIHFQRTSDSSGVPRVWYKYNPERGELTSYDGPYISKPLVSLNNPTEGKVHYVTQQASAPQGGTGYTSIGAIDLETKIYTAVTSAQFYIGKNECATRVGNFSYSIEGNNNITIRKVDLTTGVITKIPTGVKPKYYYISSLTYKEDGVFYITVSRAYYYSSDRPSDASMLKVDLYEWIESSNTLTLLASNIPVEGRNDNLTETGQTTQFIQSLYSIYESGRIYFLEMYSERTSSSTSAGYRDYLRHFVLNVEQRKLEMIRAEGQMTWMGSLARAGDNYYYAKSMYGNGIDMYEYYYQKD